MSKILVFENAEGSISVAYKATLKDPFSLTEQFFIEASRTINTYREQNLFYYWIPGVPWTLNEMRFFAINNKLCVGIFEVDASTLVTSYGVCEGVDWRIFTDEFSDEFA